MQRLQRQKNAACFFIIGLLCCASAAEEENSVNRKEGATVTLHTRDTEQQHNTQIIWMFANETSNKRIASVYQEQVNVDYEDGFKERLKLDSNGSLTITKLRLSDSGIYMYQSIGSTISSQGIQLVVYSSLCSPSIKVNKALADTGCSSITAECCVENSKNLTLSWFRGKDRVKEISNPDLSSNLSLPLEITSHSGYHYSCVAENPVEEKAVKLQTEDTCLKNRGMTMLKDGHPFLFSVFILFTVVQ
ncbi:uncharacterized protein V6R79_005420 [Siganus canaliculatus]